MKTKKSPKQIRFAGSHQDTAKSAKFRVPKALEEIITGQFCKLIRREINACLCLTIEGGKLCRLLDSEPLKQVVEHTASISLANVLQKYHLTPKIKATLAYILAQSVWQFYDSDWMKTRWTSETIQFVRQYSRNSGEGIADVFASKPYFSVCFGKVDADACEATSEIGEIHRYPRVRSLGIMLVEIGLGFLLTQSEGEYSGQSQTKTINADWIQAKKYSDTKETWPDFDYRNYRAAVKNCLDPGIFAGAPFIPNASSEELAEGLRKRRKILHDSVVYPLREVVQGTGWMDEINNMGPLRSYTLPVKPTSDTAHIRDVITSSLSTSQKDSKKSRKWLKRISSLNESLKSSQPSRERIRIAILDTGYDADAVFFQPPTRRSRLIHWKDWVENAAKPLDSHGHGTHSVSLVMKMAPEAEICVARVASDPGALEKASENVAKVSTVTSTNEIRNCLCRPRVDILTAVQAIDWAQSACKADIVTMSFGFSDDKLSISKAIRSAVNNSNESVLFFAAAANSGANEKEMFPARHECVISMRGTNSNGQFQDFNPPRNPWERMVFGTLGLEVPAASLSNEATEEVSRSGSSIATAVAAGMAGMLLGYVDSKTSKSTYHAVRNRLRTRKGMLAIFEALASPALGQEGCLYVAPWDLQGDDEARWTKFEAVICRS